MAGRVVCNLAGVCRGRVCSSLARVSILKPPNLVYSTTSLPDTTLQTRHPIPRSPSSTTPNSPSAIEVRDPFFYPGRRAAQHSTMVQPRLSQCIRRAFHHSRARSRNFSSSRDTSFPPSVARLLGTGPADPSNVVVNGFVRSLRSQKQRAFASIGDGSSLEPLQALLTPEQAKRSDSCIS